MDFNPRQFRQPAFRGFGDQAIRSHRVTPTPQSDATSPAPAPRAQGQQGALFSADEVRNPQGPPAPTFNASQFRISQHALPGMSTRSMASQRVTPPPAPSTPAEPATFGSGWTQPELSLLGPTPASMNSPSAAGPNPTHWPSPQPSPSPTPPTPAPRTVTINGAAYHNAGPSRPSPAAPSPAPAAPGPAPVPTRPTTPPAIGPVRASGPTSTSRAAGITGLAVGLGAKAFQSVNRVATDPARSGEPLYKTSGGWNKA
ncbi:hypothetical protein [Streptomyces sp. NPDC059080]|uniref:hypothetical protein n=1 Tax=Streptomyces sp. NPDC059080 TaxID=3346718 RepID=UPI00368930CB